MSYYAYGSGTMNIDSANFPDMLAAVRDVLPYYNLACVHNLYDLFQAFGFDYWQEGSDVQFEYGKFNDQEEFLEAIAPWVDDFSRIYMTGEDGSMWMWAFKDHQFYECSGDVTYRGDPYAQEGSRSS